MTITVKNNSAQPLGYLIADDGSKSGTYVNVTEAKRKHDDKCNSEFSALLNGQPTKISNYVSRLGFSSINSLKSFINSKLGNLASILDKVSRLGSRYLTPSIKKIFETTKASALKDVNDALTRLDSINQQNLTSECRNSFDSNYSALKKWLEDRKKTLENMPDINEPSAIKQWSKLQNKKIALGLLPRAVPTTSTNTQKLIQPEKTTIQENPHLLHNVLLRNLSDSAKVIGVGTALLWGTFEGYSKLAPKF
jgi:hypothetical protein